MEWLILQLQKEQLRSIGSTLAYVAKEIANLKEILYILVNLKKNNFKKPLSLWRSRLL